MLVYRLAALGHVLIRKKAPQPHGPGPKFVPITFCSDSSNEQVTGSISNLEVCITSYIVTQQVTSGTVTVLM